MDDISNKSLATLLIVAIVISLGGTFFAMRGTPAFTNIISGKATTSGTTRINISSVTTITLAQNLVDFGSGYLNQSNDCALGTDNGSTKPLCWYNLTDWDAVTYPIPFVLRNDGNTFINVTINSTNASNFIGGVEPTIEYWWRANDESDGGAWATYDNGCNETAETDAQVEFNNTNQVVCTNMTYEEADDAFNISIGVTVEATSTCSGACNATVTFIGTNNAGP